MSTTAIGEFFSYFIDMPIQRRTTALFRFTEEQTHKKDYKIANWDERYEGLLGKAILPPPRQRTTNFLATRSSGPKAVNKGQPFMEEIEAGVLRALRKDSPHLVTDDMVQLPDQLGVRDMPFVLSHSSFWKHIHHTHRALNAWPQDNIGVGFHEDISASMSFLAVRLNIIIMNIESFSTTLDMAAGLLLTTNLKKWAYAHKLLHTNKMMVAEQKVQDNACQDAYVLTQLFVPLRPDDLET
jgi:hypothetical protein